VLIQDPNCFVERGGGAAPLNKTIGTLFSRESLSGTWANDAGRSIPEIQNSRSILDNFCGVGADNPNVLTELFRSRTLLNSHLAPCSIGRLQRRFAPLQPAPECGARSVPHSGARDEFLWKCCALNSRSTHSSPECPFCERMNLSLKGGRLSCRMFGSNI